MKHVIKLSIFAAMTALTCNSFAGGFLNSDDNARKISKEQAKSVALIHARSMNAAADINTTVRLNAGPKYEVSYVSHFQYDGETPGQYRVIVERQVSYQSCKLTLTVNDRNGDLLQKSVACE